MDVLKIASIVAGVVSLLAMIAISVYYLWPYLRKWFTTNKVTPMTSEPVPTSQPVSTSQPVNSQPVNSQPVPTSQRKLSIPKSMGPFSSESSCTNTPATPPILPPKEVPTRPGSLSKTWPLLSKQYKMNLMQYDTAVKSTAVEESTEDEYIEARKRKRKRRRKIYERIMGQKLRVRSIAVEELAEDEYVEARIVRDATKGQDQPNEESPNKQNDHGSAKGKSRKSQNVVAEVIPLKNDSAMREISEIESLHTKPVIAGSMTPSEKQLSEILRDSAKPTETSKPSTIRKLMRVLKKTKKNKVAPDSKIVHIV